jgi:hypothetical protein
MWSGEHFESFTIPRQGEKKESMNAAALQICRGKIFCLDF